MQRVRADFPYLRELVNGKPVAYLDSAARAEAAASARRAARLLRASYANVHRGVYRLAERATERYEGAREKVRAF